MYLIDGHNLIGSGLVPGINLEQEDDEWRLVQWLRARQPQLGKPIIIVFDSGIPGGVSQALSGGGVTAIFAAHYRNRADQIIFQRVQQALPPSDLLVVTGDTVLREAVQSLGAQTQKPAQFMKRLQKRPKRRASRVTRASQEPKLSKDEVEAWLELFEGREGG